jgi:hypothetical protein
LFASHHPFNFGGFIGTVDEPGRRAVDAMPQQYALGQGAQPGGALLEILRRQGASQRRRLDRDRRHVGSPVTVEDDSIRQAPAQPHREVAAFRSVARCRMTRSAAAPSTNTPAMPAYQPLAAAPSVDKPSHASNGATRGIQHGKQTSAAAPARPAAAPTNFLVNFMD